MDEEKVKEVLDEIRPGLQADGGDIELVKITDDNIIEVKLQGACVGCPMSALTIKNGVERILKQQIPEVEEVRAIN